MFNRLITLIVILASLASLTFLPGTAQARPLADAPFTWGNGADGDLTIATGTTFNIHANNHPGRMCSNGGDGASYEVIGLTATTATLRTSPYGGCLNVGDETILINMQGSSANTGNYELRRVQNIAANMVTFTTHKKKSYGANAGDDSGLGASQRVMLQRVPNYNNLTLNGKLIANAWNGTLYGLMVFRVKGNWLGSGNINVNYLGYRGGAGGGGGLAYQGDSWPGAGIKSRLANGGAGAGNSDCPGGQGNYGGGTGVQGCMAPNGVPYGSAPLARLYPGSGGGGRDTGKGGNGGGAIYIMANNANFLGTITAKGQDGQNTGGGAGGSIRIEGAKLTLGVLNALGGEGPNTGVAGDGRIALYYVSSWSSSSAHPKPYTQQIPSAPTALPTFTLTKTHTPTTTPDFNVTGTALSLTLTAQRPTSTPDFNATSTPDFNATGTAWSLTSTAQAATHTPTFTATILPSQTPDLNATGTAQSLTATAWGVSTSTPDLNATGTALSLTATAWASSPTPSITPTITLTPTLSPTSSPSITPTGLRPSASETPSGGGGGGGGGSGGDATPTPTTSAIWSSGSCGSMILNVYVYVDGNNDSMMAAQGEGVNGLLVNFLDTSFGQVGQSYSVNGKASFCVPGYLKGQTLRVDIPYLQRTGMMQASQDGNNKNQPLEMWFRLEPPTLPLYIP